MRLVFVLSDYRAASSINAALSELLAWFDNQ